jgi:hypothetical protein
MTPEERAAYLQTLGWSAAVANLPLAEEINETNLLEQTQKIAAAVRSIHDLPAGD